MNAVKRRRVYLMRHGSVTYFDEVGRPYPPDDFAVHWQDDMASPGPEIL